MGSTNVIKRSGSLEPLDLDKLHVMVEEACKGLAGVSASQVEIQSGLQFYDGITTSEIQEILIKSAADLISLDNPNYQFVAARLLLFSLRKKIFGKKYDHPNFYDHVKKCVDLGVYDPEILDWYTKEEFEQLESYIDHDRDYLFTYSGLRQAADKYVVQDRLDAILYETPQMMYMMIAATGFHNYPKETRLNYVRRYYNAISKHKINIPTPIMSGVREPLKQYASCVLVDVGDNLDSIGSSDYAILKYVAQRAGIGINSGRIRGINGKIKGGKVISTGVVPYLKKFEATVRSCTQNGVRGGSATTHFPIWHQEIEDILVLKNNKGSEDNRVRRLDYSIQMSKIFYLRFIRNEEITLFSPKDVPGLYEAFGHDEFDDLYLTYEADPNIPKKRVSAHELIGALLQERAETGRIYIMNIDHCNSHSSFIDPIYMSNLCVSPETKILTADGHKVISSLDGQDVKVWNGEEWSEVTVTKTSEKQELLKVVLSNGEIECTPYHKFYIVDGSNYARDRKMIMKRAFELSPGDKLIKCIFPTIEGSKNLDNAYTLGIHTGDGSYHRGNPFITLYEHKRELINDLSASKIREYPEKGVTVCELDIPKNTKFMIPDCEYTIKSRLEWLAGYIDADGYVSSNGIQIKSVNKEFITDLKLMLQTLGVNANLTYNVTLGGPQEIKGKLCNTKHSHRICINGTDYQHLLDLGLGDFIKNKELPTPSLQRDARSFNVVQNVIKTNRFDSTYCFTEEKRGMGIFNGILTGNCQEITLPTVPMTSMDDKNAEIALCILSAINLSKIRTFDDLEELCDLAVRFLDELIDHQDYPIKCAEISTKSRRSLGIGYIGLAHYLAKNEVKYDDPAAWKLVHDLTEAFQYYLIKASINLAKEKGPCAYYDRTKYSKGILPIDTYKKDVDEIVPHKLNYDWDGLRSDLKKYGIRNSTLSAQMPSESSSVVSNTTNGIEPPRDYLSIKKSKKTPLKQIVPQYQTLKNHYTLLWDMPSNTGYINIVAVMQKFFDQAISGNWSYNPENYPDNKVPLSVITNDFLTTYKYGWKTSYYQNTYDSSKEDQEDSKKLEALVASIEGEEEICESCSI